MADVIVLTTAQLGIALDSLSILFLIISIFFLYKCKEKVLGTLKNGFTYFIFAFATIIMIKGFIILSNLQGLSSLIYDSLLVIPLFLLFLGVISFYKSLTNVPAPKHYHRKVDHRRKRHHRRR